METNGQYKNFLAPNEKVIKVIDYANSEFIWDLVWGFSPAIILGIFTGFVVTDTTTRLDVAAVIIGLLLGAYFTLSGVYKKLTLKYFVTDKRVIVKKGLIGQSTVSADYSKVTDVTVQQGILGKLLLHTGTIVLNMAGSDLNEVMLKWIQDPFKTKDAIYEQLHKK